MRDRLASPELAQYHDPFAEPRAALPNWRAGQSVFLRELAADTNAKDEAPLGQMVEGRNLLGHRPRVPQWQ